MVLGAPGATGAAVHSPVVMVHLSVPGHVTAPPRPMEGRTVEEMKMRQ